MKNQNKKLAAEKLPNQEIPTPDFFPNARSKGKYEQITLEQSIEEAQLPSSDQNSSENATLEKENKTEAEQKSVQAEPLQEQKEVAENSKEHSRFFRHGLKNKARSSAPIETMKNKEEQNPFEEKKAEEKQEPKIVLPNEEQQLEEAEEAVKAQKSKKKKWTSLIGFVINILVVAGILTYQLLTDNSEVAPFSVLIANIHWEIFLLVIVCFALIMFCESAKFWVLIRKTCKVNRPVLAYKVTALGRYYDSITPLATGGQPFQVMYMNKRGLKGSDSLSVCMGKYVLQQLTYIAFALVVMIVGITLPNEGTGATVVTATSWVGFALNAFVIVLVGFISISKKVGDKLVSGTLKLLCKMKILKNYDKHYMKVQRTVNDYQTTMKVYAKDPKTFFSIFGIATLNLFLIYSLPFLIHASFYGFHFELFGQIFIYCVMVDLASSFFPLPGGTGASELSFSVLFANLFGIGGNLFWAMLIWRFFTYYIYIIQGLVVMAYDYFRGNKKFEWTKKKWALEEESRKFEEKELQDFELSLEKKKLKKEKKQK